MNKSTVLIKGICISKPAMMQYVHALKLPGEHC
jgi:hypothetical protein